MSKIKLATTALGLAAITSIYSQDKPNVVFILTDDLGYGDLSCYGQDKFQTPNIDRLALTGTRFTRSYSGTTVSAPSRASLLTGLHTGDRKSTRLNSSHVRISYAVFCLKKKKHI